MHGIKQAEPSRPLYNQLQALAIFMLLFDLASNDEVKNEVNLKAPLVYG